MLRVSKLTDYGTLVLSQMAGAPGQVFSANDLAGRLGLGLPTVSKILKSLARAELVASIRGQRGGYSLSRPPDRITLADVVDALEEQPFGITECTSHAGQCGIETGCRVQANWRRVNDVVRQALEAVTLAEMVEPVAVPIRGPVRGVSVQAARTSPAPARPQQMTGSTGK